MLYDLFIYSNAAPECDWNAKNTHIPFSAHCDSLAPYAVLGIQKITRTSIW